MAMLGVVVPGGFGIKPPQWLKVEQPNGVVSADVRNFFVHVPAQSLQFRSKDIEESVPPTEMEALVELVVPTETADLSPNIITIAPKFVKSIPTKHLKKSGNAQKTSFIDLVLPLILASNDELRQRRASIIAAGNAKDRVILEQWSKLYRIDPKPLSDPQLLKQLLERVDTIPVALALAQAAVESGWGTSRFVLQGNALFGQWAWDENAGMRPLAASNGRAVVRSFGSLLESVRAYMHNLNTHQNYQRFRNARFRLISIPEEAKANRLMVYLDSYAEIGEEYVVKLGLVMNSNEFNQFSRAKLG